MSSNLKLNYVEFPAKNIPATKHFFEQAFDWEIMAYTFYPYFYADKEKAVLQRLSAWQRDAIAKQLWQIKESYIKVYQYTLAQGLGIDYAYLIEDLIDSVIDDHHLMTVMDRKTGYRIAIIPRQHIVIVF